MSADVVSVHDFGELARACGEYRARAERAGAERDSYRAAAIERRHEIHVLTVTLDRVAVERDVARAELARLRKDATVAAPLALVSALSAIVDHWHDTHDPENLTAEAAAEAPLIYAGVAALLIAHANSPAEVQP